MAGWIGSAKRGRAFKVLRRRNGMLRLRDEYGTEFSSPIKNLDRFDYRELKSKPAYAAPGRY